MAKNDYSDRLNGATYAEDQAIHFGVARARQDPDEWVELSERLVNRLTNLGLAYDLHQLSRLDIYGDARLKTQQCERLFDEILFLSGILKDPAVGDVCREIGALIKKTLDVNGYLMISGN